MDWAPIMGPEKYGITAAGPASNAQTELTNVVSPSAAAANAGKALSAESPLAVFAVLAAFTFGLMAFSTSVRVGHTTASVNLGSTK